MNPLSALIFSALFFPATPAFADYSWTDNPGEFIDLLSDGRPVARYVYEALDDSSPQRREETYKPFCHLYQFGSRTEFLTKGAGGNYTHHRGIFYGFSKINYIDGDGNLQKNIDTWHCRKACQIHRKFSATEAGKDTAHFTSQIEWIGDDGKTFANESRTMRFSKSGSDLIVAFDSTLTPAVPSLTLDGDPQHAGFHFRAHNDVHDVSQNATYYIRPVSGIGQPGIAINWSPKTDNEQTRDLPWKGMCFMLGTRTYSVAYLDHPDNPKPSRSSERQYGRFGTYFTTTVVPEKPLSVRYRLIIRQGEMTVEEIEKFSGDFTAD